MNKNQMHSLIFEISRLYKLLLLLSVNNQHVSYDCFMEFFQCKLFACTWNKKEINLNCYLMRCVLCRLCIYGCLPMGHNEGLIEIVTKASTLAKIQVEFSDIKLTASFNKACLYEWLKKHNTEEKR